MGVCKWTLGVFPSMERTVRKRGSYSVSTKGVISPDCTVEITGEEVTNAEIAQETRDLLIALQTAITPEVRDKLALNLVSGE